MNDLLHIARCASGHIGGQDAEQRREAELCTEAAGEPRRNSERCSGLWRVQRRRASDRQLHSLGKRNRGCRCAATTRGVLEWNHMITCVTGLCIGAERTW